MPIIDLKNKKNEIEMRFFELQNQKLNSIMKTLDERRRIHLQIHKMPTIRVAESIQNRKAKLDVLKPLTAVQKKRAVAGKFTIMEDENSINLSSFRNGLNVTPSNANSRFTSSRISEDQNKSELVNYRTLQELNAAFFSASDSPKKEQSIMNKSAVSHGNQDSSYIVKFADQPITTDEARMNQSKNTSSKLML